jgi:hypothetical protein
MNFTMRSNDPDERAGNTSEVWDRAQGVIAELKLANEPDAMHGEGGNRPMRFHEVPLLQESSPFPTASDAPLRSYTTAGGRPVVAYEMPEDEGTFFYCAGCDTRKDQSYGWAEKTFSGANDHAAECRATGNKAVA